MSLHDQGRYQCCHPLAEVFYISSVMSTLVWVTNQTSLYSVISGMNHRTGIGPIALLCHFPQCNHLSSCLPASPLGGPTISLGGMPPPHSLADIALIAPTSTPSVTLPTVSSSVLASVMPTTPSSRATHPLLLSPSCAPLPRKLVDKIRNGEFIDMKELLTDNIALLWQLEEVQPGPSVIHHSLGGARPRLREVSSITTWVYCFLYYCAIRTDDLYLRNLLVYARLLIREALRHGGTGWLEYDKIFRQQAAADPSVDWSVLNSSLLASTILSARSDQGSFRQLCQEVDHTAMDCALHTTQDKPTSHYQTPGPSMNRPGSSHRPRPETLERICTSWNKGRCAYPGTCSFRHKCATCRLYGHKARDCKDTPETSEYKQGSGSAGRRPPVEDQGRVRSLA